jgi:hypothetical protein
MAPPMNPWQRDIREGRQQRERGDWWNRIIPPEGPDYYPSSPWLPVEPQFEMPGRMICLPESKVSMGRRSLRISKGRHRRCFLNISSAWRARRRS